MLTAAAATAALLSTAASVPAPPAAPAWNYGRHGADWGAGGYPFCRGGPSLDPLHQDNTWQSPVDINATATVDRGQADLAFCGGGHDNGSVGDGGQCSPGRITNGHTWELQYGGPGCLGSHAAVFNGTKYGLDQYHFHSGSENTVGGERAAMELHMVHLRNDTDRPEWLVVAVLLTLSDDADAPVFNRSTLPADPYATFLPLPPAGAGSPTSGDYSHPTLFSFTGSMTTPTCQSGVRWVVFETSFAVGRSTLKHFLADVGPARTDGVTSQAVPCDRNGLCTYRAQQPLNGRKIARMRYDAAGGAAKCTAPSLL